MVNGGTRLPSMSVNSYRCGDLVKIGWNVNLGVSSGDLLELLPGAMQWLQRGRVLDRWPMTDGWMR
jgi:hypothetical protein